MKTYAVKAHEIERKWHVLDADGQTLGRMASGIATLLKGKHKPMYSPHLNVGDFVVVVNAEKIATTGKKLLQKQYYRHSQYPGGFRSTRLETVLEERPTRVIEHAVKGMLSHSPQGRDMFRRLKVYAGPEHPHQAQVNAGSGKTQAGNKRKGSVS